MIGDPWPEEPDDPFEEYGEPDLEERFDLRMPSPEDAHVPRELLRRFWALVGLLNVGLFGTSLGLMLVAFEGEVALGGVIALVGAATLVYAVHRYRVYREREGDEDGDGSGGDRNG